MNLSATTFADRLARCLQSMRLEAPRVEVFPAGPGGYKYFGRVVSPTFEGQYEGQRQAQVWEQILQTLDDDDQARVEFVFTDTPSEWPTVSAPSSPKPDSNGM